MHILIEMEIEELLLDALLQLNPLLHGQSPETNLVLECVDPHFEKEVLCSCIVRRNRAVCLFAI